MRVFEPLQANDPQQVGRYRILARLGSGGMGVVYLGRSRTGRAVAVKVVNASLAGDPEFRLRFAREVALARTVSGFFTAGVIDADPEGPPPWLVTAYVPGLSLEEAVERHGPWPQDSVRALGAGLAEALESIHSAGVVHRDLKPANVLLAVDGPRVIDFGISVAVGGNRLTHTGVLVGTPGFMAPEQLTGDPVGPPGDVFCLGAILTYAATGAGPFGTGSAQSLWYRIVNQEPELDALPAGLHAIVAQCLDKRPDRRPTPEALLNELTGADGGTVTELFAEAAWLPEGIGHALRADTAKPLPVTSAPASSVPDTRPPAPEGSAPPVVSSSADAPGETSDPTRPRAARATVPPISPAAGGPATADPPPGSFPNGDTDTPGRPSAPPHGGDTHPPRSASPANESSDVRAAPTQPRAMEPSGEQTPAEAPAARRGRVSRRRVLLTLTGAGVAAAGFTGWRLLDDGDGDGVGTVSGPPLPPQPGSLRWAFATGKSVSSSPAVADGVVYCGSGDHKLYAIDAATGRRRWAFTTGDEVFSSPAVAGGVVYVGSGDRNLYAIDAATGRRRWTYATQGWLTSSPAVADGIVYVGSVDRGLHAVDVATGRRRWVFTAGREVYSSPTVADGSVYVGSDDGLLYAVDAATGRKRWACTTGRRVRSAPAVVGGTVYVSSDDRHLDAVDTADGRQLWTFSTGARVISSPKVVDGVVYVGGVDRNVYAIDAATGRRRWTFTTAEEVHSSPAIADGVLYIGGYSGGFYAIDLATGRRRWTFATGQRITSGPAVADGTVYLSSYDTKIYALRV
ncbi:PQQ-binding-like beta-propeller repeat protein [Rhizohabitans arisaemae]|uniref:outer membrane protein assembly factor BamB family protein n=1 Tax=Rhizohabitans arisaemae TaxID=2720610 RepID=UPI0024B24154|nr:PQQ-binding-like beta-propeller repeat protein [Rhizohabitans arisaemae]